MWFIGVEVEQETSAPPPEKKSWIRPCCVEVTRVYVKGKIIFGNMSFDHLCVFLRYSYLVIM